MKMQSLSNWMAILAALLPIVYLAFIWKDLPETVPVHYGLDLKPDKTGNKSSLWFLTGSLSAVSIGTYFMLINLHRIDPKRRGTPPSMRFEKLALGIVFFIAIISILLLASAKGTILIQRFLFPVIGLLLAFIGNNLHTIKPNYFAGIRLPWTLSSDENWRKTHQMAGKLWFAGGLLIVVLSLLVPQTAVFPVFISLVITIVFIPVLYSYRIFKQQANPGG